MTVEATTPAYPTGLKATMETTGSKATMETTADGGSKIGQAGKKVVVPFSMFVNVFSILLRLFWFRSIFSYVFQVTCSHEAHGVAHMHGGKDFPY